MSDETAAPLSEGDPGPGDPPSPLPPEPTPRPEPLPNPQPPGPAPGPSPIPEPPPEPQPPVPDPPSPLPPEPVPDPQPVPSPDPQPLPGAIDRGDEDEPPIPPAGPEPLLELVLDEDVVVAEPPAADAADAPEAAEPADPGERQAVRKTYKLFVGGGFPRSESGRSYEVRSADRERFLANAARASRKDARDAVVAARKAFPIWSGATAYNRGQILYRIAEMLEGRRAQFVAEVADAEGVTPEAAAAGVDAAIDRWVWYAGWSDKIAAVSGAANPVAGPYFNFSVPEPTGVVAIVAPPRSSLLGLVSTVAPVIVGGNTCVVVVAEEAPLPAVTLGEVLATSDLPGGVVNLLTGYAAEVAPWLATHMDVNGIDLAGVDDAELATDLEAAAAENLKRVRRPLALGTDWADDPGTGPLLAFLETKTVWHPVGV